MTTLSLFQTLPMSIVDKIVEYLEGSSKNLCDSNLDKHNKRKKVLRPLLHVSEYWRAAALGSLCDNCEICLDDSPEGYIVRYHALPVGFPFPQYRGEILAKLVVVCVPSMIDIFGRKFSTDPSLLTPDFPIFPSATKLIVYQMEDEPRTIHNIFPVRNPEPVNRSKVIVDFASALLRLTPVATDVVLSFFFLGSSKRKDRKNRGLCNIFVSELCRGTISSIHVESRTGPPLPSFKLNGITQLTRITQGSSMVCTPFAQLAYNNARTLQELSTRLEGETEFRTLIYGSKATQAVYCSLSSLSIQIAGMPYGTSWAAIKDAAPFPVLRKLDVLDAYPFEDNLFFRGNGSTLQCLNVPFDAVSKNIFGRFGILERRGFTRMRSIAIGPEGNEAENQEVVVGPANDFIGRQARRMAEVATTLSLGYYSNDAQLYNSILRTRRTAVIRHLELRVFLLDTAHVIDMVTRLPNLVSLELGIKGSVPNIEAIPASGHPSILLANHYQCLNTNFRKLVVIDDGVNNDKRAREIAVVAVQITVLCPNFRHVDLARDMRNTFSREIAWATVNPPFLPY
ncbi:hypothetical protein GGI16_005064, partial [Coemansia sp. S142-1]